MEKIFSDLRFAPKWSWAAILVGLIAVTLACSGGFYVRTTVFQVLAAWGLGTLFLGPVVLAAARRGHKHVPTVCFWTAVWLLCTVATFLYWYFCWPRQGNNEAYERILNVVPVLTAIVPAGLGWYVHYQFSAKSQRTNSSFALIMEMMKSSEYLKRNQAVSDHFPPTMSGIPAEYDKHFAPGAEKRVRDEALSKSKDVDQVELERAEALTALRYVLNYYEFMAVGVRSNDIDCDLLVETVGQIVVGRFKRSKRYIDWIRSPQGPGQEQAFEHLEFICREWEQRIEEQQSSARKRRMAKADT